MNVRNEIFPRILPQHSDALEARLESSKDRIAYRPFLVETLEIYVKLKVVIEPKKCFCVSKSR